MTEPKKPMDRQKKEAKARTMPADAPESFSTATLEGKNGKAKITVLPYFDWDDDWRQFADRQDFRGLAESILDDKNFAKWVEVRPTVRQARDFVNALEAQTGEDLGESQAS